MSRKRKARRPTQGLVWGEDCGLVQSAVDALQDSQDVTPEQAAAYFRAVLRAEVRVCREDLASKNPRRLVREPGDRHVLAIMSVLDRLEKVAHHDEHI